MTFPNLAHACQTEFDFDSIPANTPPPPSPPSAKVAEIRGIQDCLDFGDKWILISDSVAPVVSALSEPAGSGSVGHCDCPGCTGEQEAEPSIGDHVGSDLSEPDARIIFPDLPGTATNGKRNKYFNEGGFGKKLKDVIRQRDVKQENACKVWRGVFARPLIIYFDARPPPFWFSPCKR